MTVYIDDMGHLIADSRDELHTFAARIGMKREWFQDRPRLWHYDVMSSRKRADALRLGALPIDPRSTVRILNRIHEEATS